MDFHDMQAICGLRTTQEVMDDLQAIPDCAGVYMIFGDTTELVDWAEFEDIEGRPPFRVGGTDLLYIGSSMNLRARISCHVKDDSTVSTFRMSIGCLLMDDLDLEVFNHPARATFHFGQGEARLTRWMCLNTAVAIWPCTQAGELEKALIKGLPALLNIAERRDRPYAQMLQGLRDNANDRVGRQARKARREPFPDPRTRHPLYTNS